jgi:hypothetical protein
VKKSNDDPSAATEGRMAPLVTRWGMRGMEDFTAEELARLQQKLDGWIGQRTPTAARTRRRPWVMQRKAAHPAYGRETT